MFFRSRIASGRFSLLLLRLSLASLLLVVSTTARAQEVSPVVDLRCQCLRPDGAGPARATLEWLNPLDVAAAFDLLVRRDGEPIALVPGQIAGAPQTFADPADLPEGPHIYEVTVQDRVAGRLSLPQECIVLCPPAGPVKVPVAVIAGPAPLQLVLPRQGPVEALLDGRDSRDSTGGEALRYAWRIQGDAPAEVESPLGSFTRVRFLVPGSYQVELTVREAPEFTAAQRAVRDVQVFPPDALLGPPRFLPPPQDTLVAVAGRPFSVPLVFEGGPYPALAIAVAPPAGLTLEGERGRLLWVPPLELAGTVVPVQLRAVNEQGSIDLQLLIQVLHPGHPVTLFSFQAVKPPRAGVGGGGSLGPAPPTLDDGSAVQPDLDLQLSLGPGEDCSVRLITADGIDPHAGLAFAPECAPGSSGLYFSGAAATKLLEDIDNDFTIELFLSAVSASPPAPAYVLSTSAGTGGVNFLVRHDGPVQPDGSTIYTAQVNTGGPLLSVAATPDPATGLTHLVFVRQGSEHRLYASGALAASGNGPASLDWDPDFQLLLGNSSDEARPFHGRVHMAAVYANALPAELIAYLSSLGPGVPAPEDVPAPIADICPDPREIRRVVEGDGSLSRSAIAGGGGGEGGGGSFGCPDLLLAPFAWEVDARDAATGEPRGDVTHWYSGDACRDRLFAAYDQDATGRCRVELTLTVTQVPVRGVVRSASVTRQIVVPTHFRRGDSNLDLQLDIADGVNTLLGLFRPGHALPCLDAADANDDGRVDLSDPISTFDALFRGGQNPPAPFPDCGADPSDDLGASQDLGCVLPPTGCLE